MTARFTRATLLYDGQCPLCSRYVRMLRLRDAVACLELLDARSRPDLVAEYRARGYDIDAGMILRLDDQVHHADDALVVLAALSSRYGRLNRVNARLLSSPGRAKLLYPLMRAGRTLLLRLLGRDLIVPASKVGPPR